MPDEMTLKQLLAEPQKLDDLHIPQNIVIDILFLSNGSIQFLPSFSSLSVMA